MKNFRIAKLTFGGKILQRIVVLSEDKVQNGFEIITLVKGLVNASWITMLHLQYITVEEDGDFLILHYPSEKLNESKFLSYVKKYSLEDRSKMVQLILEEVENITCLENEDKLVIFSKGKQFSVISKL
ncbi:MAG: hypothetical protein KC414_11225 [Romboutsia sp.]|nr:hypothetical protein [Romboutsia sp.]